MIYIDWEVVPNTGERVLRNKVTGKTIEFTDDIDAPEQELPPLGIADMFDETDIRRLQRMYTKYELVSGGA